MPIAICKRKNKNKRRRRTYGDEMKRRRTLHPEQEEEKERAARPLTARAHIAPPTVEWSHMLGLPLEMRAMILGGQLARGERDPASVAAFCMIPNSQVQQTCATRVVPLPVLDHVTRRPLLSTIGNYAAVATLAGTADQRAVLAYIEQCSLAALLQLSLYSHYGSTSRLPPAAVGGTRMEEEEQEEEEEEEDEWEEEEEEEEEEDGAQPRQAQEGLGNPAVDQTSACTGPFSELHALREWAYVAPSVLGRLRPLSNGQSALLFPRQWLSAADISETVSLLRAPPPVVVRMAAPPDAPPEGGLAPSALHRLWTFHGPEEFGDVLGLDVSGADASCGRGSGAQRCVADNASYLRTPEARQALEDALYGILYSLAAANMREPCYTVARTVSPFAVIPTALYIIVPAATWGVSRYAAAYRASNTIIVAAAFATPLPPGAVRRVQDPFGIECPGMYLLVRVAPSAARTGTPGAAWTVVLQSLDNADRDDHENLRWVSVEQTSALGVTATRVDDNLHTHPAACGAGHAFAAPPLFRALLDTLTAAAAFGLGPMAHGMNTALSASVDPVVRAMRVSLLDDQTAQRWLADRAAAVEFGPVPRLLATAAAPVHVSYMLLPGCALQAYLYERYVAA